MIRRFNYTDRRRIRREDARVSLRYREDDTPIFSVDLSLNRYRLPGTANVFIEAYRPATSSFMRFDWGTVQRPAPAQSRNLADFGTPDGILFRVKIVEGGEVGRVGPAHLLALAERIRPQLVDNVVQQSFSLLNVVPSEDLSEVWRVFFPEDGDEPVLLINRALVDHYHALVRDDRFIALALPQILRLILTRILIIEKFSSHEDSSDWRSQWLSLCRKLPGVLDAPTPAIEEAGQLENEGELESWIDEVIAAFVRKVKVDKRFSDWWRDEENR